MDRLQSRASQITVVIPNYNGILFIRNCLQSLLRGTWVPRIIVVDNGSTDGSRELVEEEFSTAEYRNIRLMKLPTNTGFCHAVNVGLHLVRTPYVVLLNNDIIVEPDCIEQLYTAIVQHRRAFSVQAKMLSMQNPKIIDDAGDFYCALGWAFARGKDKSAERCGRESEIFSACAGAAIYRMKVFDEIGVFDERHFCYLEDVDIGYRAKIYGYKNFYAPRAIVYHHGSAASGSRHNAFKEEMTSGNSAYLAYKNMPAFQYALNAPLLRLGQSIKRRYFYRKGLGEAFDTGLERGEYLKGRAKVRDYELSHDLVSVKAELPIESCLTSADEAQQKVRPLYLGGKVPFTPLHLPHYVRIQAELWGNTIRRLFN